MRKFLTVSLFALVGLAALGLQAHAAALVVPGGTTPGAPAGCSCRGTTPVCCYNCDGSFAYCSRSHAFCPECAAP
jgi:hypothetical protein